MRIMCLALAAVLGVTPLAKTGAQAPSAQGVSGTVVADAGGRPLARATVVLREIGRTTDTDSLGAFRLLDVPAGTYTLVAQHLGFGVASARVSVDAGKVLDVEIAMIVAVAQELPGVRVTADSQRWGKLAAFERRRQAQTGGKFLQQAELDSAKGRVLSEVLQSKLVSATIVLYPRTGAELVASRRGMGTVTQLPRADPFDNGSPTACFSQVFLDGVQIYAPAVNTTSPVPDMRRIRPETLAAVEYYSGPAVTPPEFGGTGAACGTIVLWTRDR
jgi:hypothetical protein